MSDDNSSTPTPILSRPVFSRFAFHEDDYTHPCHPLYVHPSDVLGTSLVLVPFDGTGYGSWRHTILVALSVRNKLDFVNGVFVKPRDTSPLLFNSLSKDIARSVEYSELAKDIWGELEERYGQADAARIFGLKKDTVYSILLSDEKQRQVSTSPQFLPSSASFNAGVSKKVYPYRVNFDSSKPPTCKYCKKPGHTIDKCYKLHGYPPNFKFTKGTASRKTAAHVELEHGSPSNVVVPGGGSQSDTSSEVVSDSMVPLIMPPVASATSATSSVIPTSPISSSVMHDVCVFPSEISANVTSTGSNKRHLKVQTVRSDNALELGSSTVGSAYFSEKGIIHQTSCPHTSQQNEPNTYSQAASSPEWQDAMKKEFETLEANGTWEIVQLPLGKKPIDCKWVYKVKYKADGTIKRYKARLVLRGDTQVEGIDFHETFSPVVKMSIVKTLIVVKVKNKWPLFQLDVNNAFLHGDLNEEVFMKLPPSLGYVHSLSDYSMFPWGSGESFVILVVYVDDIIITGTDLAKISVVKAFLHDQFKIKDLGNLNYFLGIEVLHTDYGMHGKLKATEGDVLPNPESYRCLIGKLNFLTHTRPDTSFAVQHLNSRKSVSGFCILLGGSLVDWKSKKQSVVSLSSAEAEYRSMSKATAEIIWVSRLLSDLGIQVPSPIQFFCDNQATIHIVKNPVFHERTKHAELDCHFIRGKLTEGLI
uniref:Reverse transcriptase Ty1/copia-type domain-containing protein n=1 Tax=Nicotiana tabacum TaxID=4097 RepID=A0A1S3Z1W1_TOBAC|nr:PREDICTED: uncharacterized protein LOC107781862 [Nicotiana tabacum]